MPAQLRLFVLVKTLLVISSTWASAAGDIDTTLQRRRIEALRAGAGIKVDGILTEHEWQRAGATDFTQRDPVENAKPSQRTEVWIAYDDAAIYFAARLYDDHPDSIVSRIGRRDADLNADWFYVGIDSYHDRRTGYYFGVYPSGAIRDGTLSNDSWDDNSWDGVWDAATQIDDKGWTVEMRIPYSQLRFSKQDEYVWGVNFIRSIERHKERNDFVMVPKKESGWVSRFADLTGIRDINPPARMEILPYVVSSHANTNQFDQADPFHSGNTFTGNVGVDVKLGLGSNLTLNATVNPDFGQVEVDPAVVNLTQFETFFQEKRPFFIEGSSFYDFGYGGANNNWGFNWGNPDYFYSRRIGRSPQGSVQHSGYTDIPDGTTILAAGKLTGKIADAWSLGTLHAVTQREYARVDDGGGNRYEDVVEPFTSYNVVRSLKEFNEGRQAIGILGTGTIRSLGNETYLQRQFNSDAYALGVDGWTNIDSAGNYVVTGWLSTTRVEGTSARMVDVQRSSLHYFQRPDIGYVRVDSNATSLSGYAGRIAVNKQHGNFSFNAALGAITPGFESNDLGFLFRTDVINMHTVVGYSWYEPDGVFRRKNFNFSTFRNYTFGNPSSPGGAPSLFGGYRVAEGYSLFFNAQFMNYWNIHGNLGFNPAAIDVRNTRGGPMMRTTNQYSAFMNARTDGRQAVVFGLGFQSGRSESGGWRYSFFPGIEFKPSSSVSISVEPQYSRDVTIAQFVQNQTDASAVSTYGTRHIFGRLEQHEVSSDIRLDWTFTPKLSLQVFLQPLISVGAYNEFKELKQPGTYTFNEYGKDNGSTISENSDGDFNVDPDGSGTKNFIIYKPDFNFKSLRGNTVLRWEYLPGSTLFFVWTRNGTNFDNREDFNFGRDFSSLVTAPDHQDAILIKLAYWWHP